MDGSYHGRLPHVVRIKVGELVVDFFFFLNPEMFPGLSILKEISQSFPQSVHSESTCATNCGELGFFSHGQVYLLCSQWSVSSISTRIHIFNDHYHFYLNRQRAKTKSKE